MSDNLSTHNTSNRATRIAVGEENFSNGSTWEDAADNWNADALKTPAHASSESRRFFEKMSVDASPAAMRAVRISETQLQETDALDLSEQNSFLVFFQKGLDETFLLVRLTFKLLYLLGLGWRWNIQLWRLLTYALLLLPGFLQMAVFYLLSKRVIRSIPYGRNARNRLDMYIPRHHWKNPDTCIPVVIYVTGGAWTIGYKAWGSLLGRRLSKSGVLVCCLDYRNFPQDQDVRQVGHVQGTVVEMMEDVNTGIAWVLSRIRYYGGNPNRIHLVGQSCGAQLGMMCLLTQVEQEEGGGQLPGGFPQWSPSRVQSFVGVSGVYNCYGLADHLHRRGLYRSLFERIMSIGGEPQLKLFSPTYCVKGASWVSNLPRVLLLHGDADMCAPLHNAEQFGEALSEAGGRVTLKVYKRQTHTSPLIENPMRGGRDVLQDDILAAVTEQQDVVTKQRSLCPDALIRLAAAVCPF